jgi:hypothetical protein
MIDRQKILQDMDKRLRQLDEELEGLRSRVEGSAAATRAQARKAYDELRARRDELTGRLEAYRESGKAAGRELAAGFRKSLEELKKGLAGARQQSRPEDEGA